MTESTLDQWFKIIGYNTWGTSTLSLGLSIICLLWDFSNSNDAATIMITPRLKRRKL